MSHIADSRKPRGIGILPLQHEDYDRRSPPFSVSMRSSILAVRIMDRDDQDLDSLGQWIIDPETAGTLEGGNLWRANAKLREVPGWAFAWPAVISDYKKEREAIATGIGIKSTPLTGEMLAMTLYKKENSELREDGRYLEKPVGKGGFPGQKVDPFPQLSRQDIKPQDPWTLKLGVGAKLDLRWRRMSPDGAGFQPIDPKSDGGLKLGIGSKVDLHWRRMATDGAGFAESPLTGAAVEVEPAPKGKFVNPAAGIDIK